MNKMIKTVGPYGRMELTRAGKQFVRENYPSRMSEDIAADMGISYSTLHRLLRHMRPRPKKDPEWLATRWNKRRASIARDRRRIDIGLEPLTRMIKENPISPRESRFRYLLRTRYGYIVRYGDRCIRYDDTTRRSAKVEGKGANYGLYFRPAE